MKLTPLIRGHATRQRSRPRPFTMMLALSTMLLAPLDAAETGEKIVAVAQDSHVFKSFLIDDAIRTMSKEGVVTWAGTVHEESCKQPAQEAVAGWPGVKGVVNNMIVALVSAAS